MIQKDNILSDTDKFLHDCSRFHLRPVTGFRIAERIWAPVEGADGLGTPRENPKVKTTEPRSRVFSLPTVSTASNPLPLVGLDSAPD
jgi:hypothetical protein